MNLQPNIINHFTSEKQAVSGPMNLSLLIDNELFMFAIFNQNYSQLVELCHINPNEILQQGQTITDKIKFLTANYQLEGKPFKNVWCIKRFVDNVFNRFYTLQKHSPKAKDE